MKVFLPFIGLLIALNLFGSSLAQELGTIIPLYSYPRRDVGGNAWQRLLDAYRANPIPTWAILNVYNGPGEQVDANYVSSIAELRSTGIKTMGYVFTLYGQRNMDEVKAQVDRWKSFYNVQGIFFDEMAYEDDEAKVNYYRELNNYAKSQGFTFTVGNPGTRTIGKYFDTVDNIVIFEEGSLNRRHALGLFMLPMMSYLILGTRCHLI